MLPKVLGFENYSTQLANPSGFLLVKLVLRVTIPALKLLSLTNAFPLRREGFRVFQSVLTQYYKRKCKVYKALKSVDLKRAYYALST